MNRWIDRRIDREKEIKRDRERKQEKHSHERKKELQSTERQGEREIDREKIAIFLEFTLRVS